MNQTLSLLFGILGITSSITGTIMMLQKLKIDLTGLKAKNENETKNYSGYDAYVNLRMQIEDSIKHTNKTDKDEKKGLDKWLWVIIAGAFFQVLSLLFSLSNLPF